MKLKILHLEDLASDAELVERELKKGNIQFEKIVVGNRADFEMQLVEFSPQIILSDHSLPAFNSIEALKIVKESGMNVPFILVTGNVSEEFAVSIIQQGADDYILKNNLYRLTPAITRSIDKNLALQLKFKTDLELKTAHERILFHLENSPLGYIEWDNHSLIRSMSKKAEDIFGWTIEEFNYNHQMGISQVYKDDQEEIFKIEEQLLNGTVNRIKVQHRSYTKVVK